MTLRQKKRVAITTQNLSILYGMLKYAEPEARKMVICNPRATMRLLIKASHDQDKVVSDLAKNRLRQLNLI